MVARHGTGGASTATSGSSLQVKSLEIVFQVLVNIGSVTGDPVAFLLSFLGSPFLFTGAVSVDDGFVPNWTMDPELKSWMILMPSGVTLALDAAHQDDPRSPGLVKLDPFGSHPSISRDICFANR